MTTIIQIGNSGNQLLLKSIIYECKWKFTAYPIFQASIAIVVNDVEVLKFYSNLIGTFSNIIIKILYEILHNRSLEKLYSSNLDEYIYIYGYEARIITKANSHIIKIRCTNEQTISIHLNQDFMDNFLYIVGFSRWRNSMLQILSDIRV